MPELKEVFDMVTKQTEPEIDSWSQQEERQRRTARVRKIGVFALSAAIAVVAVVAMLRADDGAGTTIAGTDTTPSPEQVAASFADAYGAFDADGAIGHLADNADVSGLMLGPGDVDETEAELRLNLATLNAMGFVQLLGPCEEIETEGSASIVQCPFDFHIAGSDYQGQSSSPTVGAFYELSVERGEVTHASVHWGVGNLAGTMQPFADWVLEHHPDDAALLFTDDSHTTIRLSQASIRVWRRDLYRFEEQPPLICGIPQSPC